MKNERSIRIQVQEKTIFKKRNVVYLIDNEFLEKPLSKYKTNFKNQIMADAAEQLLGCGDSFDVPDVTVCLPSESSRTISSASSTSSSSRSSSSSSSRSSISLSSSSSSSSTTISSSSSQSSSSSCPPPALPPECPRPCCSPASQIGTDGCGNPIWGECNCEECPPTDKTDIVSGFFRSFIEEGEI